MFTFMSESRCLSESSFELISSFSNNFEKKKLNTLFSKASVCIIISCVLILQLNIHSIISKKKKKVFTLRFHATGAQIAVIAFSVFVCLLFVFFSSSLIWNKKIIKWRVEQSKLVPFPTYAQWKTLHILLGNVAVRSDSLQ